MDIESGSGVPEAFKAAFRGYPTGVAVITAAGPVGLTASSVASVCLDPPTLSFSVLGTPSARAIVDASSFVVHLLGAAHADLARDFARTGGPRFTAEQGWRTLPTGEPLLDTAPAALRCVPLRLVAVGASTVVIAQVVEVFAGPSDGRLIHHDRTFITSSSSSFSEGRHH